LLLSLVLPQINPYMMVARIDALHVELGAEVRPGSRILDVNIDLGPVVPHDCPPAAYYRIVARDHAWLRRLDVALGDQPSSGDLLALFSLDPDEPLAAQPGRSLRVSVAQILPPAGWVRA